MFYFIFLIYIYFFLLVSQTICYKIHMLFFFQKDVDNIQIAEVEFRRELQFVRESIGILLVGVCKSLNSPPFSFVQLLTIYKSLSVFSQINLAGVFARVNLGLSSKF